MLLSSEALPLGTVTTLLVYKQGTWQTKGVCSFMVYVQFKVLARSIRGKDTTCARSQMLLRAHNVVPSWK